MKLTTPLAIGYLRLPDVRYQTGRKARVNQAKGTIRRVAL